MFRLRRDPLLAGAVTVLCSACLILAAMQISRHLRFGELRYVATQLETDRPVARNVLERAVTGALALQDEGICQSEFLKAALTVTLTKLDHQNQDVDYEAWSNTLLQAESLIRFSLSCIPTDGNLWARLAMVRQAISEQPDELAKLVTFSQLYAPAEENVIDARYRLYNRVTKDTLALLGDPMRSDLEAICSPQGGGLRRRLPPPGLLVAVQLMRIAPECNIGRSVAGKTGR
ncbi:hypothetical protein [Rhizobium terrae]|uniref:hypothetical protein n=1 Tax=Rhizobium terrae TaxID=2171756 RepID=UPI000E3EA78D|nr:hypothetical protein [Rhizobium terrae]